MLLPTGKMDKLKSVKTEGLGERKGTAEQFAEKLIFIANMALAGAKEGA
jgi:hypothetical protein